MKLSAPKPSTVAAPPNELLLTTEEAAAHLKLTPKTIRALCTSRRISAIRVFRRWRISAEELARLKQAHLSQAVRRNVH